MVDGTKDVHLPQSQPNRLPSLRNWIYNLKAVLLGVSGPVRCILRNVRKRFHLSCRRNQSSERKKKKSFLVLGFNSFLIPNSFPLLESMRHPCIFIMYSSRQLKLTRIALCYLLLWLITKTRNFLICFCVETSPLKQE